MILKMSQLPLTVKDKNLIVLWRTFRDDILNEMNFHSEEYDKKEKQRFSSIAERKLVQSRFSIEADNFLRVMIAMELA